jgi:hypothetical protein
MGWNYRVFRHPPTDPQTLDDSWYAVHEAYYRSDDVDDLTVTSDEISTSVEPVGPSEESVEALRDRLGLMLAALDKPVLDYRGHAPDVQISLTPDEALVLFELSSRVDDDDLRIEHRGETRALWNLCATLERRLIEPFKSDYRERLAAARERLAGET